MQPGTGRKRFTETDYAGAGAHPLSLTRHYSSRWTDGETVTGLSAIAAWDGGWRHAYQASITLRSDGSLRAFRPDGTVLVLKVSASVANTWVAEGSRDTVTAIVNASSQRTGYSYVASQDDSTETYDNAGKLLTIKARNGWLTTLTYSDVTTPTTIAPRPGLLISVKNQFGRELKFTHDTEGRIAELLPPGAIAGQPGGSTVSPIRYAYAEGVSLGAGVPARSQLTSITWQDGAVKRYHYDDARWPQAVTGITDEAGVRNGTYVYDAQGRVTRSELAGGTERLDFGYGLDASGKPTTTVTDYTGSGGAATSRTYNFTDIGYTRYPAGVSAPCSLCGGTQQASSYNANGNPVKTIAHDGTVTFYAYDAKWRETERATFPSSYQSAATRPALAYSTQVVSTKWHATFNLPTQVAEPNKTTANTYNSKGMLTGQSWTATTDATGAAKFTAVKTGSTYATGWGYSANSLNTSIVEKVDGVIVSQAAIAYDAVGSATRLTNALTGEFATGTYDAHGRLVTEIDLYGARSVGYTTTGLVLQDTFVSSSAVPVYTLTAVHNAVGLVTELNTGTGLVYRWTYKPNHAIDTVTLNGNSLTVANTSTKELLTRSAALNILSRDAKAQMAAPGLPLPSGGLRGPGWIGVGTLIFQIGRNVYQQQTADAETSKEERCDPCKDPTKKPRWTSRGSKHTVPPSLAWSAIRAGTSNGRPAKYKPEWTRTYAAHEALELSVWAEGKVIKNTNSSVWKVKRLGFVVGAADGLETSCVIVLCAVGEIHGYPAPESDCDRPAVAYP